MAPVWYENINDKCGRKSFWKLSKTAPFSFENGWVWTGPKVYRASEIRIRIFLNFLSYLYHAMDIRAI